jgi:sortase A
LVAERAAWGLGLAVLAVWGAIRITGMLGARHELDRFTVQRAAHAHPARPMQALATPDMTLWDLKRVTAWRATLAQQAPPPLAILRIPRLRIEVAVLPGTDEFVLDRGVGHIDDTALPGTDGNSGIAGHRDGFFRGLKDITTGDAVEIETLNGREMYHVERTWLVNPEDVSVLDPTPVRSLTLVTCYPFYFIGSAPQRFIVRAVRGIAVSQAQRR